MGLLLDSDTTENGRRLLAVTQIHTPAAVFVFLPSANQEATVDRNPA